MPGGTNYVFVLNPDTKELWAYSEAALAGKGQPIKVGVFEIGKPIQQAR